MNTAVLTRRIDPNLPLADASALLMAADAIATARAPVVAKSTTRHARRFKRTPEGNAHGATTMFRRRLSPSFTMARQPVMRRTNMASSLLMAGPDQAAGKLVPQVSVLTMSKMRARAEMVRIAAQRKAQQMRGTLRQRFVANAYDWNTDHRRDLSRLQVAEGRFASARGPRPDLAF